MPGSESDPEHVDKQPLAQTTSSTPLLPEASCQSLQVSATDGSAAHAEKIRVSLKMTIMSDQVENGGAIHVCPAQKCRAQRVLLFGKFPGYPQNPTTE